MDGVGLVGLRLRLLRQTTPGARARAAPVLSPALADTPSRRESCFWASSSGDRWEPSGSLPGTSCLILTTSQGARWRWGQGFTGSSVLAPPLPLLSQQEPASPSPGRVSAHLYGCSPVCVLRCLVRFADRGKIFPQYLGWGVGRPLGRGIDSRAQVLSWPSLQLGICPRGPT